MLSAFQHFTLHVALRNLRQRKSNYQPYCDIYILLNKMSGEAEQENGQQSRTSANETSFNTVTEGKARVSFPGSKDDVFYNPVQEFNRDLRYVHNSYSLCVSLM